MEGIIQLWPGGPRLLAGRDVQSPGTDSVLLAHFAPKAKRYADLGCGGGVLALLLADRFPDCQVVGLDVSEAACALARQAVAVNQLERRIAIRTADLRDLSALPEPGSFDGVVCNPPYFALDSGATASGQRPRQRSEESCTILQVCQAAARLLRWGGTFSVVYRTERLTDLLFSLRQCGLEPKRLRLVRHHPGAAVSLVLCQARRGGKPGLQFLDDLILQDGQGHDTAELAAFYHREEPL